MKTPAAQPEDRSNRASDPDSLFGLDALLACRRSEAFAEDLADLPGGPPAPASAPVPRRAFGLRLAWRS